jgi:hypothetical protein
MWAQVKRKYIGTLYRWFVSERTSAPSSLRPQTVRTTFISVSLAFRRYRIGGNLNVRVTHKLYKHVFLSEGAAGRRGVARGGAEVAARRGEARERSG